MTNRTVHPRSTLRLRRRAFRRADRAMVALARAGLALLAGMIVRPDALAEANTRSSATRALTRLECQRRQMIRLWDRARAELDTAIWQARCHAVKTEVLSDPVARAQILADLGGEGALRRWEGRCEARQRGSRAMALAELRRVASAPTQASDVRLRRVHPDVAERILSARAWPLAPGPSRRRDLTARFALAPVGQVTTVSGQRPHARVRLEIVPGHGVTLEEIATRLRAFRQAERDAHHARLISADPSTRRAARLDPRAHLPIWLTADELREGLSAEPLPMSPVGRGHHHEREVGPDVCTDRPVGRPRSVRVRESPWVVV